MAGTLYIVATPIGNLDDMPPRVAATFGAADFVAAEDTRVTMKLLNFLGLKKPMVSYYEHALQKGEGILRRIEAGENCALCSDAGMPCISDPGEQIVREAHAPEAERPEEGDEQPGGQQALGPQQLRLGDTGRCPADAHRRQCPHHQAEPAHRGRLIFLLLDAERPQQRRHQIPERRREDEPQR